MIVFKQTKNLNLIRPRNRIVPTDNMNLRIKDLYFPLYYIWHGFPYINSIPRLHLNVQMYMRMPVFLYTQNVRDRRYSFDRIGKSGTASNASIFVNFFDKFTRVINKHSFYRVIFFIFEVFALTILNCSQNQTIEVVYTQ